MDTCMTLTFFLNQNVELAMREMEMVSYCVKSLSYCQGIHLLIYNQGYLRNETIDRWMKQFNISYEIIGDGMNVGIPKARYECIRWIMKNHPSIRYIGEIHMDMIFSRDWHKPLISYIERTDEPMVGPRIIWKDKEQYLIWDNGKAIDMPNGLEKQMKVLEECVEDQDIELFVNPLLQRIDVLTHIGAYDIRFLKGKQGYEDDSLLLGYSYYMGTRQRWKPKCYLGSCVYHKVMAQRMYLRDFIKETEKNKEGLIRQYGAYGCKELARIRERSDFLELFYQQIMD